jgi:hypothetical protein
VYRLTVHFALSIDVYAVKHVFINATTAVQTAHEQAKHITALVEMQKCAVFCCIKQKLLHV